MQTKLLTPSLKIFALVLSLFFSLNLYSQKELSLFASKVKTQPVLQSQLSPLQQMAAKREDVSKRDAYSKHFINDDGSITAVIGSGPMHYEKNGSWMDVNTDLVNSANESFSYENKTNLMETFFGKSSNRGIVSKTKEGEVREFLNPKMYWEVNGNRISEISASDVAPQVNGSQLWYKNIFGHIDAEFTVQVGKRKLNYIIPNRSALANIPVGASYLVFSEDLILSDGFKIVSEIKLRNKSINSNKTHFVTKKGIFVVDKNDNVIYSYEAPYIHENYKNSEMNFPASERPHLSYTEQNGKVTFYTKVSASWLQSPSTKYPIAIDPTVTVYPSSLQDATGQCFPSGGASGDIYAGYNNGWYRGWAIFNTTSLPSVTTVTAASVSLMLGAKIGTFSAANGIMVGHSEYDLSSVDFFPSYADIYNAITNPANATGAYVQIGDYTASASVYQTFPLHNLSYNEIAEKTGNDMAFFPISFSPSWGTGTTNRLYGIYGYANTANRPYLTVTYTNTDNYCHSAHKYANCAGFLDAEYIGISNVNMGTINNTTTFNNVPVGYNRYNLSTDVKITNSYPLQVTYKDNATQFNAGKVAVWVDWNADGDFGDANEFIGVSPETTSGNQVLNFTITVPAGTSLGTKRMRVRSAFKDEVYTAADFCKTMDYGETEDYNLNVITNLATTEALKNQISVYKNGSDFIINSGKNISAVEMYDMNGRRVLNQSYKSTEVRIPAANLSKGTYILKIFSNGESEIRKIMK